MKKIFYLALFLVILMVGYINIDQLESYARGQLYYSICETPKTYRIGSIDDRYNMSSDDFLIHLQNAEKIWEDRWDGNLFEYKSDGDIEVNLVYDQRSFLSGQINQLDSQVRAQKNDLNPKIEEYKRKASEFQANIKQLNTDISYWNERGGAPPEEFDKLIERQKNLQAQSDNLKQEAEFLNQSTALFNQQIGELQGTVDNFNQQLAFKPEEGEYIYDNGIETINIYFDNSETELVHTLAHELGHSLRIEHNNNKLSIMYPETTTITTLSADDLIGLNNACAEKSILKDQSEKINIIINQLYTRLTS